MPFLKVNGKLLIRERIFDKSKRVNGNQKSIHHSPFAIHWRFWRQGFSLISAGRLARLKPSQWRSSDINAKPLRGFSLIEFLVVVSIFGIAASLITASYLNFERNQKVRGAASQLKNDLRLTQNRALSGDKGPGGACAANSNLGGWYLSIQKDQRDYKIGGDCLGQGFEETAFGQKTINLPSDIKVNKIADDLTTPVVILFRPLSAGVTFHKATFALANENTPDFFEPNGTLKNYLTQPPQSAVTIEFSSLDGVRRHQVKIEVTGEISDVKPQ